MSCRKFDGLLEKSSTMELDQGQKTFLDDHLAMCAVCREKVAGMQALDALLDRASDWTVPVPPYLSQRILANLPARTGTAFWSWRVLHPIAAVLSLVVAIGLGFLAKDLLTRESPETVARVQAVKIIFYSPQASSVALIGDFNEWGARDVTLAQSTDRGIWEFSLSLKPGVYHYNLLVDGERWVANPKSSTLVPDGFGGYNSVLVVSEKCQDDCT